MRLSDLSNKRRLEAAFVASILIHLVLIGASPVRPIPVREEHRDSIRVVLERRPAPKLRPTPAPRPVLALATPRPLIAPRTATAPRATARPARQLGGSAAPKELAKIVPTSAPLNGTATAAGNGVAAGGSGTGAGPGTGTGGANGSGTGTGGGGPCGHVGFNTVATAFTNGKWYETISVYVEYADGHQESAKFPYPWVYNSDRADPWSVQNLRDHPNMAIPAQTPPPGVDMSAADPVVKYVLVHTTPEGKTLLPLCPGQGEGL
jgi:hypothetical protein